MPMVIEAVTLISTPPALAWLAQIEIAAGGGGDQVAHVDVGLVFMPVSAGTGRFT